MEGGRGEEGGDGGGDGGEVLIKKAITAGFIKQTSENVRGSERNPVL